MKEDATEGRCDLAPSEHVGGSREVVCTWHLTSRRIALCNRAMYPIPGAHVKFWNDYLATSPIAGTRYSTQALPSCTWYWLWSKRKIWQWIMIAYLSKSPSLASSGGGIPYVNLRRISTAFFASEARCTAS